MLTEERLDKQTISAKKTMCTVSWNKKGVVLVNLLPHGEVINSENYKQKVLSRGGGKAIHIFLLFVVSSAIW